MTFSFRFKQNARALIVRTQKQEVEYEQTQDHGFIWRNGALRDGL